MRTRSSDGGRNTDEDFGVIWISRDSREANPVKFTHLQLATRIT